MNSAQSAFGPHFFVKEVVPEKLPAKPRHAAAPEDKGGHGCQTSTEPPESAHLLPLQETQKAPPPNLSQLELKEACSFGSVPGLFYASNLWKQLLANPFQSGSSTRYFPPV